MDKLTWFKFTPSDWMMGKIQRCPEVTQSRFLRLCCLYWNKECNLSIEDSIIEIDKEHFDVLVSKKIICTNEEFINISFLDEQYLEIQESNEGKSKSGIIGNLKRWHPEIYNRFNNKEISLEKAVELSKTIAYQSQPDSTPIATQSQSIADKIREDEIKKDNIDIRKLKFADTLKPFVSIYGKELLSSFYKYWTEPNKSNTKFKQEMEKTWDTKRRLETWVMNENRFSVKKQDNKPKNLGI